MIWVSTDTETSPCFLHGSSPNSNLRMIVSFCFILLLRSLLFNPIILEKGIASYILNIYYRTCSGNKINKFEI